MRAWTLVEGWRREENRWAGPPASAGSVYNRRCQSKQVQRSGRTTGIPLGGAPDLTIAAIAVLLLPFASPVPLPLDTLVDVGGYQLHMVVYRGTQPLTIVMESGGGASLAAWS